MRSVALSLIALLAANAANAEMRIGLGAALNNNEPTRPEVRSEGFYPGQLVELDFVFNGVAKDIDAQLGWTYIMESDFGTEQAVTLTFLKPKGRMHYGAGLILGYTQAYERWQRDEILPPIPLVGPRQCIFCDITAQVGYEHKRLQLQLRYWRTDFNLTPGHNGVLFVATYGL
jgi:hypothetical protein